MSARYWRIGTPEFAAALDDAEDGGDFGAGFLSCRCAANSAGRWTFPRHSAHVGKELEIHYRLLLTAPLLWAHSGHKPE